MPSTLMQRAARLQFTSIAAAAFKNELQQIANYSTFIALGNSTLCFRRGLRLNQSAQDHDLGFTYRTRKTGEVQILHRGRLASTLRDTEAADFISEVQSGSDADAQQLMARITGNYKHGNERTAANHPRNRR